MEATTLAGTLCQKCGHPTGRAQAKYCDPCRPAFRGRQRMYHWTPEKDQALRELLSPEKRRAHRRALGRLKDLIGARLGFPGWEVQRRASLLGLVDPRPDWKPWTDEEDQRIIAWASRGRTPHWISQQCGRTLASITLRLKRLKFSIRAGREYYTSRDLAECFGVDSHAVTRWINNGLLQAKRRRPGDSVNNQWIITHTDVLRFVHQHRTAFKLNRVDQVWFLDLVLDHRLDQRKEIAA